MSACRRNCSMYVYIVKALVNQRSSLAHQGLNFWNVSSPTAKGPTLVNLANLMIFRGRDPVNFCSTGLFRGPTLVNLGSFGILKGPALVKLKSFSILRSPALVEL